MWFIVGSFILLFGGSDRFAAVGASGMASLMVGLLFCAFSIALSRIVLGMHFLSDVLVGAGLGATLGYLSYWVYQ